jgi:hypothetical protein
MADDVGVAVSQLDRARRPLGALTAGFLGGIDQIGGHDCIIDQVRAVNVRRESGNFRNDRWHELYAKCRRRGRLHERFTARANNSGALRPATELAKA